MLKYILLSTKKLEIIDLKQNLKKECKTNKWIVEEIGRIEWNFREPIVLKLFL